MHDRVQTECREREFGHALSPRNTSTLVLGHGPNLDFGPACYGRSRVGLDASQDPIGLLIWGVALRRILVDEPDALCEVIVICRPGLRLRLTHCLWLGFQRAPPHMVARSLLRSHWTAFLTAQGPGRKTGAKPWPRHKAAAVGAEMALSKCTILTTSTSLSPRFETMISTLAAAGKASLNRRGSGRSSRRPLATASPIVEARPHSTMEIWLSNKTIMDLGPPAPTQGRQAPSRNSLRVRGSAGSRLSHCGRSYGRSCHRLLSAEACIATSIKWPDIAETRPVR